MKKTNTRASSMGKTALLASIVIAATSTASTAQAKTINVEAGPLFSKFFADIRCKRAAEKVRGQWTGRYTLKPGSLDGHCQIVVPDPVVKIIAPPPKPQHSRSTFIKVDAQQIWNQQHANQRCPQLAKQKGGRWTGKWSTKTAQTPSFCQVEIKKKKVVQPVRPTYKTIKVVAGKIWNQPHANKRCNQLAQQQKGTWTKHWSTVGNNSTCDIKVRVQPAPPKVVIKVVQPAPVVKPTRHNNGSIREVSAGGIWDANQANRKCPLIAAQTNGTWTGKWRKVGANNAAVCEVKYQPIRKVIAAQAAPAPVRHTASTNRREVDSGYIWDANQANTKCPAYAAQNNGRWTGKWRKVSANNRAVCEVEFGTAQQLPVVTASPTTYVDLTPTAPVRSSNTREVDSGYIWDGNQANTKCPLYAAQNKGTWTGKWRKVSTNNRAVCEVRF